MWRLLNEKKKKKKKEKKKKKKKTGNTNVSITAKTDSRKGKVNKKLTDLFPLCSCPLLCSCVSPKNVSSDKDIVD